MTADPPRFIVSKCTADMLGTVLNEVPDGYTAGCHHQEGNTWVVVAERAPEQLSVEMVGEPVLRQSFQLADPGLVRVIRGETWEPRAEGGPLRGVEYPEPDHDTEPFDAVWSVIGQWDIARSPTDSYAGATGTDVQVILDALRPFLRSGTLTSDGGPHQRPGAWGEWVDVADDLAEAVRLTEEYAQLPAIQGWSWFDAFRRYRESGGVVPWPGLNSTTPRVPEMGGCNICGYPDNDQHPTEAGKHEFQGGV